MIFYPYARVHEKSRNAWHLKYALLAYFHFKYFPFFTYEDVPVYKKKIITTRAYRYSLYDRKRKHFCRIKMSMRKLSIEN